MSRLVHEFRKTARLTGLIAKEVAKSTGRAIVRAKKVITTLPAQLGGESRHAWENCVANQINDSLSYFRPTSRSKLQEIIRAAVERGCHVRAIGSGHSFTDVVITTDFLVDTHGLNRELPLTPSFIKDSEKDVRHLVRVECGIILSKLNELLDAKGLAMPNLGGYDGQTIMGVVSTATHGSGITLGPIASCVQSMELIADGGSVYWIEPSNGISDPRKFKEQFPDTQLIQDDKWFHAVLVSMGCMGIVYSVVVRVVDRFWLNEERTLSTWDTVKVQLRAGDVLRQNDHFEVLVNPYAMNGQHSCLITRRNRTQEPDKPDWDRNHRNFMASVIPDIPGISKVFQWIFCLFPDLTPTILELGLKGLVDSSYIARSYKVFNIGAPNNISAYSAEIALPMTTYIDAVDHILELAEKMRTIGRVYITCPFSLRFVKQSDAYLAMMSDRDTCMIEMPIVNGTFGGFEILRQYEREMYAFGGRPHWGQVNYITGSNDVIRTMYPQYDVWIEVYKQLNANGTFNNQFTDRCGFSVINYRSP
ncbi:MAG: FAD-binding protein [Ignavibacteriae bacterium]|nr:FAD-binding protein [Ignavibacteriota bacterium]